MSTLASGGRRLAAGTGAATAALVWLGTLAASGTIGGIPSNARRVRLVVTGEAAAGAILDVTTDAVVAGYLYEYTSGSGFYVGPVAAWRPFPVPGSSTSFSLAMDITHAPGAAPQNFYVATSMDGLVGYRSSDGFVPAATALAALGFAVSGFTSIQIDAFAEVPTS